MNESNLVNQFIDFYDKNKFNPKFIPITNKLMELALKATGYNNFENTTVSGEKYFIESILRPTNPEICFDIGANEGKYSSILLSNTKAKVFAFEPHPVSFTKLSELSNEFGERFVALPLAVGAVNGRDNLFFNPQALSHASLASIVNNVDYVDNKMEIEVEVVTVDSFCKSNDITRVDLIKIDTEGYELEALHGAKQVLKIIKPELIQIEFNWHQLFMGNSLLNFASTLSDYDCFRLLPGRCVKVDVNDPLSNIYLYSNFVFRRKAI